MCAPRRPCPSPPGSRRGDPACDDYEFGINLHNNDNDANNTTKNNTNNTNDTTNRTNETNNSNNTNDDSAVTPACRPEPRRRRRSRPGSRREFKLY